MATSAYRKWNAAGRPWRVATPVAAVGGVLRKHGYTVYYLGDEDNHLKVDEPEDHTPFSTTGWPGRHPYPHILAMDVMPPGEGARSKIDGKPLPSLQQLGARLFADRSAGHPGVAWLKYMNWEPQGDYRGACWHDSWQPSHVRRASGDRGHIHASARTDFTQSHIADDYDPVARIRALGTTGEDDDVTKDEVREVLMKEPIKLVGGPASRLAAAKWRTSLTLPEILGYLLERAVLQQVADLKALLAAISADDGNPVKLDPQTIDAIGDELASRLPPVRPDDAAA